VSEEKEGERRTYPDCAEKHARILHMRIPRPQQHGKPKDTKERDANVAETALMRSISQPPNKHGNHRRHCVRRHTQQIRRRAFVSQLRDDGREEERKCVESAVAAHVDDGERPRLPVFDRVPEVGHFEGLVLGGGLLVGAQAADYAGAVGGGEEGGAVGEVVDHPVAGDALGRDVLDGLLQQYHPDYVPQG
jgi:hypothetical protein